MLRSSLWQSPFLARRRLSCPRGYGIKLNARFRVWGQGPKRSFHVFSKPAQIYRASQNVVTHRQFNSLLSPLQAAPLGLEACAFIHNYPGTLSLHPSLIARASCQDNDFLLVSLGGFSVGCPGPPMGRPLKHLNSWSNKSSSDSIGTPVWVFWEVEPGAASGRGTYDGGWASDAPSWVPKAELRGSDPQGVSQRVLCVCVCLVCLQGGAQQSK